MAGCGGCAERGAAIKAAAIAISEGRYDDAKAEAQRFTDSAKRDAGAVVKAAKARLAGRR
jgi:hypothetical protein